jgi:hypothetical protein
LCAWRKGSDAVTPLDIAHDRVRLALCLRREALLDTEE